MDKAFRARRALAWAIAVAAAIDSFPSRAADMDDMVTTFFQADQLEYRARDGRNALAWDVQGWIGGDYTKLWLKSEGEKPVGEAVEKAELQLLYSRLISDFFDVQAGLRYDVEPGPRRGFAVLGLQGLAPQFFEVDAAAFVSDRGEVSARLEAEYDLLLTQRLVLQPSVEVNVAAQGVAERGIGSGINDIELGLRLRYEIRREIAPYVGVHWERKLGRTASLARDDGEEVDSLSLLLGIRLWF